MLQNHNVSFIHSSLDLSTEIYSTAGGQAAQEQNGFFVTTGFNKYLHYKECLNNLLIKASLSISYLTSNSVVRIFQSVTSHLWFHTAGIFKHNTPCFYVRQYERKIFTL